MPSCNQIVEIRKKEESSDDGLDAFNLRCCLGEDHEGKHEGHAWILGKNRATGGKGIVAVIKWE